MPGAYSQFRSRCIQKIIAGLAVALAGVVLVFAEISFGTVTIPGNPLLGAAIAIAGVVYALSVVMTLRNRKKPLIRS